MAKAQQNQAAAAGFGSALIVDDHPLFLDALSMTLGAVAGIGRIRTAATLADALAQLRDWPSPHIVVLDLNLPDISGFDGLTRIRAAAPDTPVVVVSSMTDDAVIATAIRAGAAGFVPKHSARDRFQIAFDTIAAGGIYVPDGTVLDDDPERPVSGREDAVRRLATLTPQQGRILQLICEGRLNKQIAHELGIAETTVKAHVTAIMRKLGVQSRTQAVLVAKEAAFS